MDLQTLIVLIIELIGTIAFSISGGAMVGIRRKMDIFGVLVLGVVTAVGGGMMRDVILGEDTERICEADLCRSGSDFCISAISLTFY